MMNRRYHCTACAHAFLSDSPPDGPEVCPECGEVAIVTTCATCRRADVPAGQLDAGGDPACDRCARILAESTDSTTIRELMALLGEEPAPRIPVAVTVVVATFDVQAVHRSCVRPGPVETPRMPALARTDPDSATWRAVAQTAVATVRPGVGP